VKKILPAIFSQKDKFLSIPTRAKDGQLKRKDGVSYLYDICVKYNLPKSGKRPDLEKRLLLFFFEYPELFAKEPAFQSEYDSAQWMKLNDIDKTEKQAAEVICNRHAISELAVFKSDFRPSLLNVFYLMRKVGGLQQHLTVDSEGAFLYHGLRYDLNAVEKELEEVNVADLIGFDSVGDQIRQEPQPIRRRTQECLLRLLTIIFLDDEVFRRFIVEGKENPPRWNIDARQTGGNANIWQTIHKNFIDDDFPIAEFFVDSDIYWDVNGNLPNIKTCKSKWASPIDLYKWYKQVHADMVKVKDNCSTSGKHGFSLTGVFDVDDDQYQDFVHNFAHGQKAVCYLGALAMHRGTASFDWFSRNLPENVAFVDGMDASDKNDEPPERLSSGKKSRAGSSRGPPQSILAVDNDDEGSFRETTLDRLAAAFHRGADSPEKRNYYRARTLQIDLKNEEEEETRGLRILGRQAHESRKAMQGIVSGLKDISAAKALSNIAAPVKQKLNLAESNFENLLDTLNQRMLEDANNTRKRSRDWDNSRSQNGDEESSAFYTS
jgi:hypothetical protein